MIDYTHNIRHSLQLNKKLPSLEHHLTASFEFFNISIRQGFRIDTVLHPSDMGSIDYVEYGGKRVYWPNKGDTTALAIDEDLQYPVIGDGVPFKKTATKDHISSPWQYCVWHSDILSKPTPLSQRIEWCCTAYKSRPERDHMIDLLSQEFMHLFDKPNFFVYDGIENKHRGLISKMFRPITKSYRGFVYNQNGSIFNLAPWHKTILIELVPETRSNYFMATEKVFKPIAAGIPFVVVGCHHFMRRLRHFGFKTFHPFIDESYDHEHDTEIRIKKAVRSFGRFVDNPQHLDEIQIICDYNRKRLEKIQSYDYYQHTWKKIRRLLGLSVG